MRIALTLALLLCIVGCKTPASQKKPRNMEFRQVWNQLEKSDNWCFGLARVEETRAELGQENLDGSARAKLLFRLSQQELRIGQSEDSLASINRALTLGEKIKSPYKPEMRAQRGLVNLRIAEVKNCILRQGQSSCIFPLDKDAVHLDKNPARAAFDDLLFYLKARHGNPSNPGQFHSRQWLLNIAAMQLGEYPESVPPEFRLRLSDKNPSPLAFKDVAAGVGIIDKNLAGGAAAEDLDGDGLIDIVSSSCDFREPTRYYRNKGDGTFEDLTVQAGLQDQTGAFNVRLADYDNDGDQDILLLRGAFLRELGQVRNSLLQNDGRGKFTDVTKQAGLAEPAYPTGTACWGDFNNDGLLDLFVGNETVPSSQGQRIDYPCQLFFNRGDGTFREAARESGVEGLIYVKGVATADIDNDGDLDLFVTNFAHPNVPADKRGRNLLFRNQGNGSFEEVGREMGIDGPQWRAFATWFFDYNNDGWQDLFVVCYETEIDQEVSQYLGKDPVEGRTRLFLNNQGKGFVNVSQAAQLDAVMSTMGASFGDIDYDGFLDMYLGTGSAFYDHLVPNVFLQNVDGGSFADRGSELRLGHLQKGHGIVFCDFNNDGAQDIYAQMGGNFVGDAFSNALFQNPGHDNHFVYLKLKSEGLVVGARLEVDLGDRKIHRAVGMVSSFGHTPLRQEIGIGKSQKVERIVVSWPSGRTQEFQDLPVDTQLLIDEAKDQFEVQKLKKFELRQPQPGDPYCES